MAFTSPIFLLSTLNTDIDCFIFQTQQAMLMVMRLKVRMYEQYRFTAVCKKVGTAEFGK